MAIILSRRPVPSLSSTSSSSSSFLFLSLSLSLSVKRVWSRLFRVWSPSPSLRPYTRITRPLGVCTPTHSPAPSPVPFLRHHLVQTARRNTRSRLTWQTWRCLSVSLSVGALAAANRRIVACHAFLANFSRVLWQIEKEGEQGEEKYSLGLKFSLFFHSMNACRLSVRVKRGSQHCYQEDNLSFRCRSTSTSRRCPRTKCRTSTQWGRSTASSNSCTSSHRTTMRRGEGVAKSPLCGLV